MTARRRVLPGLGLFVALFVAAGWLSAGSAQAAVTPFVLSPTSGPPGTVVHVGGTGCSPGVSLSATSDFVEVTATTLDLAIQTPVAANGSWHASFTVPSGGLLGLNVLPAPVTAVCVSDGLDSLTTIYTPQTFTVTTASPPGTSPPTTKPTTTTKPPTSPGSTPPGPGRSGGSGNPGGGHTPDSTAPVFGGVSSPGSNTGTGTDIGTGTGSSADRGSKGTSSGAQPALQADVSRSSKTAAGAAALNTPELPSSHVSRSGGLGWLAWALLIALVIAVIATPFLLHRIRRGQTQPAPAGDAT